MAKSTVPVNFKDDIMNSSMGGKRRYKMINNSDGTISLEDATTYNQVGSNFGAAQLNATNQAVNAAADAGKIIDDLDAINNVTQEGYIAGAIALKQVNSNLVKVRTYVGSDGKLHFVDASGADSVLPFSNSKYETWTGDSTKKTFATNKKPKIICGFREGSGGIGTVLILYMEPIYTTDYLEVNLSNGSAYTVGVGNGYFESITDDGFTLSSNFNYLNKKIHIYY